MYILSHCSSYMKTLLYTYVCLQYDEVFICGHLGTPGRKDPHRTTDSFVYCFWESWRTYAKSKSTKVSENADIIYVETYIQNKDK